MARKKKNPHAVALGKLGGKARAKKLTPEQIAASASKAGKAGGPARAASLTAAERRAIAQKAAAKRWKSAEEGA